MSVLIRCSTCHRQERWSADGDLEAVLMEGGARRPAGEPALVAVRGALEGLRDGKRVVGTCSLCAQPLLAPAGSLPGVPVEGGGFRVDDVVTGPEGPMAVEEALAQVEKALRPSLREMGAGAGASAGAILVLLPIVFLWLFAVSFVSTAVYVILSGADLF